MNTIIEYKGITNRKYDLVVTDLEQRKRSEEQVNIIEIEGRSGALVDRYDEFKSYERNVEFVNLKKENRAEIHKWLSGRGVLRTSDDPYGHFYADTIGIAEREFIGEDHNFMAVTFLVEPFFYLDAGTNTIEIQEQTTLVNIGNVKADPLIKVFCTGNGTILINSQVIHLTGVMQYLTIDSKLKLIHKDGLPAGRKMTGEFPTLSEGTNVIAFTGSITKLELVPRWREL